MQSGVLAGGWLLHQSMLRAFATEFHGEKIRLGIIGCGDRGTGLMKTILSMPEEFEVVAICDVLDFRQSSGFCLSCFDRSGDVFSG